MTEFVKVLYGDKEFQLPLVVGTEGEKAMIKEQTLFPLKEIYKPTPIDKLQEMWDELPEDKKIAPKKPWDDDKDAKEEKAEEKAEEAETKTEESK